MKRKREVVELPFDSIRPSQPQMVYGLMYVGQDSDGYEYYTSSNEKRCFLSYSDSKLGIKRIKESSKSMTASKAIDIEKLPCFLKEMSRLCEEDCIVGLSIFKYQADFGPLFNLEVYNDYTVEESLAADEHSRSIRTK